LDLDPIEIPHAVLLSFNQLRDKEAPSIVPTVKTGLLLTRRPEDFPVLGQKKSGHIFHKSIRDNELKLFFTFFSIFAQESVLKPWQ
jgi:hypothetical protein